MCDAPPSAKRILIVDRGVNWRQFAADVLCREGYHSIPQEAYDVPEGEAFDLILLGCEVVGEAEERFIRAVRQKNHIIAVAALDAYHFSEMRRGFLSGAHDVMIKPLAQHSLVHEFHDLMRFVDRQRKAEPVFSSRFANAERAGD